MHDLLTRLKAHARHRGLDVGLYGECDATLSEAADEIERLEAVLTDLRARSVEEGIHHFVNRIDAAFCNEQKADPR